MTTFRYGEPRGRKIADHVRSQRKSEEEKAPSHNTVSVWTRAFLPKMAEHVSKWAPSASQTWSMDGLHMKLRRAAHYLYMIVDYDARFVLADDMGGTKAVDDAASVAGEAKRRAGDVPGIVARDGAASPSKAIRTTNTITGKGVEKRTRQATARLRGNAADLRHERLDRTAGERLRPPGTIKEKGSKLIAGFLMFYNFIRRHTGLGEKAPAEAAGFARCSQPVGRAHTQRALGESGSSGRGAGRKKTASRHGAPLCEKPQIRGRAARNGHLRCPDREFLFLSCGRFCGCLANKPSP